MNKLHSIFFSLIVFTIILTGCEDMFDVDSDRLLFPEEHLLNSPNDTIYSMVGIFTQLEKLADRYVLLGELRGDLMNASDNASTYIHEINNFEISPENPYNKIEDYYSVINHCNYLIQNIDTAIVSRAEKVMYKEFAAAKAIRAWTYMQVLLNYGSAKYYEEPILTVSDVEGFVELSLPEILPLLIKDLEPWKNMELPGGYSLGEDLTSEFVYFPVRFVLGDLYLWNGEYEKAAIEYYELMVANNYTISEFMRSTWTVDNGAFVTRDILNQRWRYLFLLGYPEQITLLASSKEDGKINGLTYLAGGSKEIIPSKYAIDNWNSQYYYHSAVAYTEGDLRGNFGSYYGSDANITLGSDDQIDFSFLSDGENMIAKYDLMDEEETKAVSIYRIGLLYLRYAEAVNRAGKPNLAFAVLKNGLSSNTMEVDSIVPKTEKYLSFSDTSGIFYPYTDFEHLEFNNNVGVHARGCGNVNFSIDYKIPALGSLEDSILFVESKILEELALETAFEGNRFHDLMRVALRRNDPGFLANQVSEKHTDNKVSIRNKLLNELNWYLP